MKLRRIINITVIGAVGLLLPFFLTGDKAGAAPPDEFERVQLATNLTQPTAFRHMPDGRIFITEKSGAIKIYEAGQVHTDPLITLVVLQTANDDERGLLGLEPHPDFEQNGYLYVSYTAENNLNRLSRITVTDDTADPGSEVILIESDQQTNVFHHGGDIRFGPDGKLYWAMGMNVINPNSQNLSNIHGKILRMNSDGSAPSDNPFINTPGAIEQIWAYGLRNPFRINFTPNDKLLAGDVGGEDWEELNVIEKGGNYGWPLVEGSCDDCPYINPVYAYEHTPPPASAGSITSVMTYTGSTFPSAYQNKVFIGDYTLGFIKYLEFDSEYSSFISEHEFDNEAGAVVQLDQGPDGDIYQLNFFPGALYKITPSGGNRSPVASVSSDVTAGLAPLTVQFSSEGTHDPDGDAITYEWDFDDGTSSTQANPSKTFTENGTYEVTLTVSDGDKTGTASVTITVGNRQPNATILSPSDGANYNAGDTISFSGIGTDPEDGELPGDAFEWRIVFHHADHTHPFRDSISGSSGEVTLPTGPDNVSTTWYRIHLTVTDSGGLTNSTYVDIRPNLVNVTYEANFPDATFTVDGIPYSGSRSVQAVVGVRHVLDAPSPQYTPSGQYRFDSWSNEGDQTQTITVPSSDTSYVASFNSFQNVPEPWQSRDIGSPHLSGFSGFNEGTFTINAAGGDIWGPTDEFHYVYQSLDGDGEIITRVTSQDHTDDWAKSGIMIKESATAGAPYALLAVTPANGITFQHNFDGDSGSAPYEFPNAWLRLTREGNVITAYTSADGESWTQLGQVTIAMDQEVTVGLAVTSHKFDELNESVFDNVSVVSETGDPGPGEHPWDNQDIGGPAISGSATLEDDVHTITGSGDDIWGDADQFHYVYQPLDGDGEIVARVTSHSGATDDWAKSGIMIKSAATAGSDYALLAVTPANGIAFQHSFNSSTGSAPYEFPNAWLRLTREGNVITGYVSAHGTDWTQIGTATISMPAEVTAGLYVSSHDGSVSNTATFDNVAIIRSDPDPDPEPDPDPDPDDPPTTSIPEPWQAGDVGEPGLAGSSNYEDGIFTIRGAGDDIWGDADQFQFVHQALAGDGEIVARVTSQSDTTDGWAKAGIMIKESATYGTPYALLAVTPDNGIAFQHGFDQNVNGTAFIFPDAWLQLTREGGVITAYFSSDGESWQEIGSATIAMEPDARIGLFVSSHDGSALNTATFDNVTVTP